MKYILLAMLLSLSVHASKEWTLYFYFSGDNNLSEVLSTQVDMLKQMSTNANILIKFDGEQEGDSLLIVRNEKLQIIESNTEYDMGKEETLASFVKWGLKNYPSHKKALIINGHGRGIVNLPLNDGGGSSLSMASSPDSSSDSVFNEEVMTQKLQGVLHKDKFDILVYAACLMGNLEILLAVAPITNFVIASEYEIYLESDYKIDTVIAEGISFRSLIETINNNPSVEPHTIGVELLEAYHRSYDEYKTEILRGIYKNEKASLALYDLREINVFSARFNQVLKKVSLNILSAPEKLSTVYLKLIASERIDGLGFYADLGIILGELNKAYPTEEGQKLLNDLYSYKSIIKKSALINLPEKTLGLSLFFPSEKPTVGGNTFEYVLKSYTAFSFNDVVPIANFSQNYLTYINQNRIPILTELITEIIKSHNADKINELLYFKKMEVLLMNQPRNIVLNYYKKISRSNYQGFYFKKHLKYIKGEL